MADFKSDAREFGKINFDFLLMVHIQDINKQLAKLPHESIMTNVNEPIGTTYRDILQSYYNMVQQLAALLKPYWDDEYRTTIRDDKITFNDAKDRFGFLMELCDRKGFLFTKMKVKASGEADEQQTYSAPEI